MGRTSSEILTPETPPTLRFEGRRVGKAMDCEVYAMGRETIMGLHDISRIIATARQFEGCLYSAYGPRAVLKAKAA